MLDVVLGKSDKNASPTIHQITYQNILGVKGTWDGWDQMSPYPQGEAHMVIQCFPRQHCNTLQQLQSHHLGSQSYCGLQVGCPWASHSTIHVDWKHLTHCFITSPANAMVEWLASFLWQLYNHPVITSLSDYCKSKSLPSDSVKCRVFLTQLTEHDQVMTTWQWVCERSSKKQCTFSS